MYVLNTMRWFFQLNDDCEDDLLNSLKASLENALPTRLARKLSPYPTTMAWNNDTVAYLIWPRLYVVHVGDSRCYLFRRDRLEQLTRDHTVQKSLSKRAR